MTSKILDEYTAACERGDAFFGHHIEQRIWSCEMLSPGERFPVMGCFGGDSQVLLAAGAHKLVRELAVGDSVQVAGGGSAQVDAIWRCDAGRLVPVCTIDGVLLTPDHPVCIGGVWSRADRVIAPVARVVDAVFNFALSAEHNIMVRAGPESAQHLECCTLGMPVPGIPEPLWGTDAIFDHIRRLPGYPMVVTSC